MSKEQLKDMLMIVVLSFAIAGGLYVMSNIPSVEQIRAVIGVG